MCCFSFHNFDFTAPLNLGFVVNAIGVIYTHLFGNYTLLLVEPNEFALPASESFSFNFSFGVL